VTSLSVRPVTFLSVIYKFVSSEPGFGRKWDQAILTEAQPISGRIAAPKFVGKVKMSLRNQVLRAPNERFYVLWRGQPICSIGGTLLYFEIEREAREFLGQCEAGDRLVDLAALAK
jgi:hypothetical protein